MGKTSRNRRLVAMAAELVQHPGKMFALREYCTRYDIAKSTASEDLALVNDVLHQALGGRVTGIAGSGGGIYYTPGLRTGEGDQLLSWLAAELEEGERQLPGGFLYYSDLLFDPKLTAQVGKIFAAIFASTRPDQVLTLETKGIPLALFTAHYLGCTLTIARRTNRVTEGPSLSTNYLTGSGKRIETMFLPKRSIEGGSKVLIIDDFMKAGGSALGLKHLVAEFDSHVVGIGVLIATKEPQQKLVDDYTALLGFDQGKITVLWEE